MTTAKSNSWFIVDDAFDFAASEDDELLAVTVTATHF
jgi:hypothetical protein